MGLVWYESIAGGHDAPFNLCASRRGCFMRAEEARNEFQRAGAGVSDAEMERCGGHFRCFFEGVVKSRP